MPSLFSPRIAAAMRAKLVLSLLLVVGAVGGLAACGKGKGEEKKPAAESANAAAPRAALTVTLVSPVESKIARSVQADGNIMAWQEAIVGAEMTGRIESVSVQVGDRVKHYQELARFATSIERAQQGQLEAAVQENQAAEAEAKAQAARALKLKEQGFMGEQMALKYQTQDATANARLAQAKATRDASALRLANSVVRATTDGVVSHVSVVTGSILPAGTELFRLIQDGRLEWRAQVTAAEMNRIKPGMSATVDLGAGQQVLGKVRSIAPTVDMQTRTGLVYVDLQPNAHARAGMYVNGQIDVGQGSALLLPQSALVLRDGFSYAMKVDAQGKVKQTTVKLGRRQGNMIEVIEGLALTDKVVASGGAFLADGDRVQVVGDGAASGATNAASQAH